MFGIFQAQRNVTAEKAHSTETTAKDDETNVLNKAAPQRLEAAEARTENSDSKINRETVTALNVKVVCDLAQLLPDKGKYEVTRGEAIGMALSIENGPCRHFAVDHVVGLCRKRGELHVAKQLLDHVNDNALRERILRMCPELRHPGLVEPRHS